MSGSDSMFLNNTKKDLIGGITAIVLVAGFLRAGPVHGTLDSSLREFLSENAQAIEKLMKAVLLAAVSEELTGGVSEVLSGLVPDQPGYYDRVTINALLSVYAGETKMKDFWPASETEFRAICKRILEKKLMDLVAFTLWCRVEAYERELTASELDLAAIYLASLSLVPERYREDLDSCEEWVIKAKSQWRESSATQKGLSLTTGLDTGLTKVLSEL